ncbi:ROK family protein [Cryptosporangium phraense]|uniref:ROK family protein n=1 Tax=Cryptosporangium phraense TaxID=2593070 RepID=A0A545AY05_9ACTN|nr:ROK family protein [Cryptosporangium phraense]
MAAADAVADEALRAAGVGTHEPDAGRRTPTGHGAAAPGTGRNTAGAGAGRRAGGSGARRTAAGSDPRLDLSGPTADEPETAGPGSADGGSSGEGAAGGRANGSGSADRVASGGGASFGPFGPGVGGGPVLWAVGVASSGLVDPSGRVVLSVAIPEWTGVQLADHFGARFGVPALVDNDSRLAALAEQWLGVARYAADFVYLLAGLRTGLGLVLGGTVHRGFGGAAGEIGALPQAGWIRAQEHLAGREPAALFAAARGGDRSALGAVRRYVRDLAVGTAALVLTLDPQMVVLGGGFSRSADVLLDPLRKELDKHCIRTPEVLASALGEESVALGAIKLAVDHVGARMFANA